MPESNTQSPGLSGKRVTWWVTISMLVVGAVLGYTLWSYGELDKARAQTAKSWRSLGTALDQRYREAEQQLPPASEEASAEEGFTRQLLQALDRFRTTARVNRQQTEAVALERLLASEAAAAGISLSSPAELEHAVSDFNARLQTEREILSSPGGRLLDIFLEFPQPPPFELAR